MKKLLLLLFLLAGCGSSSGPDSTQVYGPPYDPEQYACHFYTAQVNEWNYGVTNIPAIEAAIAEWNNSLGENRIRELRRLPPKENNVWNDPELGRSTIIIAMNSSLKVAGVAYQGVGFGPCSCWIDLRPDVLTEVPLIVHEIGHCFGLEHVADIYSIMHESVSEDSFLTQEMVDLVKENTNLNDPF